MKKSLLGIRNWELEIGNFTRCILYSTLVLLFSLLVLGSSFSARAYDGDVGGRFLWWRDPKIVKELELSDDQVNQIEGIFSSHKGQMKELDSNLKKKEAELRDMIRNPNSSREKVLRLTDEIEGIKGSMTRLKVDMLLQVRDVLTPQQRSKLQDIKIRQGKPK